MFRSVTTGVASCRTRFVMHTDCIILNQGDTRGGTTAQEFLQKLGMRIDHLLVTAH